MKPDDTRQPDTGQTGPPAAVQGTPRKPDWGDLHRVTGAFFGTFSP